MNQDLSQTQEKNQAIDPSQYLSGRKIIEARLRQKTIIDAYPNPLAGAPINPKKAKLNPRFGYEQYDDQAFSNSDYVYAPFNSKLDWEIAHWAKTRGPGATAMTELLQIDGFQDALGLSYKNMRELNKMIDQQIPQVRPKFKRETVTIAGVQHILYQRDILECIKALFGAAEFAQYLVFSPERHYADEDRT